MRFSLPAVAAGGLAAVAVLTFADIAMSQADLALDDMAILDAVEATHEAEVALAELANEKGSSQEMKDLANQFMSDHKAGKQEVEQLEEQLKDRPDQDTARAPTDTTMPPPTPSPTDTMTPTRDSVMDPTRDTVAYPAPDSARDTTVMTQDTLRLNHDWTQPLDALKQSHEDQKKQLENLEGKAFDVAWVEHQVAFHTNALENIEKVMPQATSAEVKALLNKTQVSVQGHLQRAKDLKSRMVATQ
jgi:predicted outer membrane protein